MIIGASPEKRKPAEFVASGMYDADLVRVFPFANSFGARLGFEFTIVGGQFAGKSVSRSTSSELRERGHLRELLQGLLGRELTDAELVEGVDAEKLVGSRCKIVVARRTNRAGIAFSTVDHVFALTHA